MVGTQLYIITQISTYNCNKVTNGCNSLFCVFISFIYKGNKYTK